MCLRLDPSFSYNLLILKDFLYFCDQIDVNIKGSSVYESVIYQYVMAHASTKVNLHLKFGQVYYPLNLFMSTNTCKYNKTI